MNLFEGPLLLPSLRKRGFILSRIWRRNEFRILYVFLSLFISFSSSLTLLLHQEFQMSEKGGFGKGTEMEKIGKEALKYTNEFRSKNGLPSLKWSPSLFIIATKHRFCPFLQPSPSLSPFADSPHPSFCCLLWTVLIWGKKRFPLGMMGFKKE